MKKNKSKTATIWTAGICGLCLAAALLPNATAQNPAGGGGGFGRGHFGGEFFVAGRVVTGAPYSAQAVTEHTQTLADGNTIHTTITANLYRDSQGRTRREQEVGTVGPWAAEGGPRKMITIGDPVGGSIYVLNPTSLVAHQMPFPARAGERRNAARPQRAKAENANVATEPLGTQVINGVTAQGTRTTRTIPAGQMGNQAPLVITVERWYSPELQTDVMRKETNPQFGETTFQLTNIVRAEPQAALFQLPSNYTLKSGRGMNHGPVEGPPSAQ